MKKKLVNLVLLLTAMLFVFVVSGCGGSGGESTNESGESEQPKAGQQKLLNMGTGGMGGTWYFVGGGMATLVNNSNLNIRIASEVSPSPVTSAREINAGRMDLGFMQPEVLYGAYRGTGGFGFNPGEEKLENVRVIMAGHGMNAELVVPAKSSIKTWSDIKGHSFASPSPGTETQVRAILKAHNVTDYKYSFMTYGDQVSAVRDGNLDVYFCYTGQPTPGVMELLSTGDVRWLEFEQDALDALLKEHPYYAKGVIPANIYKQGNPDHDILTLYGGTIIISGKHVDEETIYNIVKTLIEGTDSLKKVHAAGAEYNLEQQKKYIEMGLMVAPLHAGAVKYFKEKGITIPDELIPPEMK